MEVRSASMRNALFTLSLLLPSAAAAAADQPNFVLIFVDDLGYADIGPFGSQLHRTPNLDRMAAAGRKLTDFYVTANVCTPSRSSLMTGSYPRRVGLDENEQGRWVLFPGNRRACTPTRSPLRKSSRKQATRRAPSANGISATSRSFCRRGRVSTRISAFRIRTTWGTTPDGSHTSIRRSLCCAGKR